MWQTIHYTYFVLKGFSWIIDSLLTDNSIKLCLYLTIYKPFLLSTCLNKNEKQAGAELGKAVNKLYRASHNRCWSYLVSSVVRIWINKDFCEANSCRLYCSGLLRFTHLLFIAFLESLRL